MVDVVLFCGILHRVRWAEHRKKLVKPEPATTFPPTTLYVKFSSVTGVTVSEELLRQHFGYFGPVLDVNLRTLTVDEVGDVVEFVIIDFCKTISY